MKQQIWISYICLISWAWPIWAQFADVTMYSVEDGLGQSQVYCMTVDSQGYLWLGTRGGGISRFDGQQFISYNTRDGLIGNYLNELFVSSDQSLWIAATQGFSRYDGRTFRNNLIDTTQEIQVYAFCEPQIGGVLIGTNQGLYYSPLMIKRQKWSLACLTDQLSIRALCADGQGGAYIGAIDGLWYLPKDSLQPRRIKDFPQVPIWSLTWDSLADRLWIGSEGAGLFVREQEKIRSYIKTSGFSRSLIFDCLPDTLGGVWAATLNHGAVHIDSTGEVILQVDEAKGLPTNHIRRLWADPWGNLWVGTSGGGLCKYAGQPFQHFGQGSAVGNQAIYAITQDIDCRIFASRGSKGFVTYDGNQFKTYDSKTGFQDIKVKSLLADHENRLWVGTEGQGAFIFQGDTIWQDLAKTGVRLSGWVRDFVEDQHGQVWVATAGGGVVRLRVLATDSSVQFQPQYFRKARGLPDDRVNCLLLGPDRIWCGMQRGGLAWIGADSLVHPVRLSEPGTRINVRCLTQDKLGSLWVGTQDGLIRYRIDPEPEQTVAYTYRRGLSSTNIYLVQFDEFGSLWVGTEKGLDRATMDVDGNIIEWKHFGYPEGFVGIETCQDAVLLDRDGTLWFGTIHGLAHYNPQEQIFNDLAPHLNISSVDLNYRPLSQTNYRKFVGPWQQIIKPIRLPWNRNHLNFHFQGINYQNPTQVRYQWRLEGLEPEWAPPVAQQQASYPNLPPGNYTFLVRAKNEDNIWSEPLSVAVEILPPVWKRNWFYAALVGLALAIIFLVFRIRLGQVRRKARISQERLQMQNAMLELEQKALQLQMNPHFIFHALNSIQGLIRQQDTQQARYYLAKFGKLMRRVLENSRLELIPLAVEIETLNHYLTLEQFCQAQAFTYEIKLEPGIDTESLLIPPMMLQPFVENAIIHGIKHLDRQGHISLSFEIQEGDMLCTITDNGIGREKAAAYNKLEQPHKASTALKVTEERLQLLRSHAQQQAIVIEDLVSAEGLPLGTKVSVSIPFSA